MLWATYIKYLQTFPVLIKQIWIVQQHLGIKQVKYDNLEKK